MEEREAELSQAYREADHPRPSPALDARILEVARQAVAPVRRPSRWSAWAIPLSTTAVLVLGLTLLFEVQRQAPEYMAPPGALDSPAPGEMRDAVPQPAEPTMPQRGAAQEEPVPQAEAMDSAEGLGGVAGQAPAAARERMAVEQRAAVPAAPEPQPFPARAGAASTAPAAKAEAQVMPAPMADRSTAEAVSNLADSAAHPAAPPSALAPPAQEKAPAASFSQTERKRKAVAAPVPQGPEQWVETIRKLMREGRLEEARTELEKLRRAYPGFALPEDLRGL